jgi:uncharacterized membrane-anchored protein
LAALKDVKLLHAVGKGLWELDPIIKKANESVATDKPDAMMKEAHKKFNSITAKFTEDAGCELTYRIDRSGFYVGQVRSNVKFLRIKRLEGYQPYDQFVERRLGGEFDFIDRLGKHYERAANSMSRLDQNYLSIETNQIDDDTKKSDTDIQTIQKFGEFVLLAFLVPYYVTNLFAQFVPETFVPLMTIGTWTVFLAAAYYKISKDYIVPVSVLGAGLFIGWLFVILVNSG